MDLSLKRLLDVLLFRDSRKVGIGLWLFICSHADLAFKLIGPSEWIWAMGLSTALVGGGTLMDTFLNGKKDAAPKP